MRRLPRKKRKDVVWITQKSSNIEINKKNLINDFIKDCLIIQGNINLIYDETNEIYSINVKQSSLTSNLITNQNYNLTNTNPQVIIPINYIRRVSPPILDITTNLISFDINDGLIPTFGNYQIKYIISTPPSYGSFVNNIINQIVFNSDNLIYIYNPSFQFNNDACGITPFIIINNEYIKGKEVFFNFVRINTSIDLLPNPIIIPDFAKEIKLTFSEIYKLCKNLMEKTIKEKWVYSGERKELQKVIKFI